MRMLLLLLAAPALAQIVASSSSFSADKDGNFAGTMTFQPARTLPAAITAAPYSGEESSEREQTLTDGTKIRATMMFRKVWRDSQGRIRSERPVMNNPNRPGKSPVIIEISDPVEGAFYVLEEAAQVAHRVKATAPARRVVAPPAGATQVRPNVSSEPLGTQLIEGVVATGTRVTNVIPEGTVGNDRPITTTSERWFSNELMVQVLSKTIDPRSGEMRQSLKNISRAEPDPALFRVPPAYSVVDETGEFTIRFTGKQ